MPCKKRRRRCAVTSPDSAPAKAACCCRLSMLLSWSSSYDFHAAACRPLCSATASLQQSGCRGASLQLAALLSIPCSCNLCLPHHFMQLLATWPAAASCPHCCFFITSVVMLLSAGRRVLQPQACSGVAVKAPHCSRLPCCLPVC
jgi:hypothetical protein